MNNPLKGPQAPPQTSRRQTSSRSEHAATWSLLGKSALATILLTATIAVASYIVPHGIAQQGDEVSPADQQARLEVFRTLAPMNLSPVSVDDTDRAIQSMQLSPAAAATLKANLASAAPPQPQPVSVPSPQNLPSAHPEAPVAVPALAQRQTQRVRLVWITLWDTDMEDGDVVRIDSQGYSRTIRLTKKGDTFAIPVPADGVIKVTGVSDGDGGGITVGLASGGVKAIFPIMSEGQILGLQVKVN
ncbi:MAG: hypothetical protein WA777_16210 [Rhodanobacter sp.]